MHTDHSALYAYAGSLPADFQSAAYLLPFRCELAVLLLFWPPPQGATARGGDLSTGY